MHVEFKNAAGAEKDDEHVIEYYSESGSVLASILNIMGFLVEGDMLCCVTATCETDCEIIKIPPPSQR